MAAESTEQDLRQLLPATKESAAADYQSVEAVTTGELHDLEQDVRLKLTADAHTANLRESLEATIRAGGGVGESTEQMLLKTGLTGLT